MPGYFRSLQRLEFVKFSAGFAGVSKAFPACPLVYLGICKGPVLVFVKKIANPFFHCCPHAKGFDRMPGYSRSLGSQI